MNLLTVRDIFGCARGVAAFVPVLLAPGYCVAWVTGFLGFRARSIGERLAWAVALSFGVMTIAAVALGKYVSLLVVCWFAAVCAAGLLAIVAVERWQRPRSSDGRWSRIGVAIVAAWIVFVVLELVDVGLGSRLYLSVTIYDNALRTAFVDAVMRTGIPPANPLYWSGQAAPMRYYYFWYVLTAVAARLGDATARQAMIASVAWSGFGLSAIVALYSRHFLGVNLSGGTLLRGGGRRWPRLALALALLTVTGLDVIPAIVKAMFRMETDADMEWWSMDQVASWMDSLLWVPHHLAGLVCCLFGFLLVWMSKELSRAQRVGCSAIAGLSFAGAFGLSTWVAVAFAMVMSAWMLWALVREPESRRRVPVLLGAGLVAVVALLPYLCELRGGPGGGASGLLHFGVRHIIDPSIFLRLPWFAELAKTHPRIEDALAGVILLLPGYFAELGFYGLILLVAARAKLDEAGRTSLVLACAGLIVATLLRSTLVSNNDFGFRSILIPQFFLLLLAVRWCEGAFDVSKALRVALYATAWIGLAGSMYQAVELRLYLPVEDRLGRTEFSGLGQRAMEWRVAFDAMDRSIPRNAVIEFDPAWKEFFRYAQVLHVRRQVVNTVPDCAAAFGGDASACQGVKASIARVFSAGQELPVADVRAECRRLGVDYLVATHWDGIWSRSSSWVWELPALVDTGDVKVVGCGGVPR